MWLRSDSRPRLSTRAGFMRMKQQFAQPVLRRSSRTNAQAFRRETAKYRINAGDLRFPFRDMHNSRVTRLCMSCTRLKNKKLQMHDFH